MRGRDGRRVSRRPRRARHPGVAELLFDARGKLLPPVYVFVNMEGMYKADLDEGGRRQRRADPGVLGDAGADAGGRRLR